MDRIRQIFEAHWNALIQRIPDFLEGFMVLMIFILIAFLVKRIVSKRIVDRTEDKLRARFIIRVMVNAIILLGIMLAMKAAGYGDIAAGLLAGAGISAFVVGFALKDIGENFLAGFLLSFSRPFRINDTIEVGDITGKVRALNLRNTHVKTFDGKDVFIPNANLIKQNLLNHTLDGYMRHQFIIGVDYGTDFTKARKILLEVVSNTNGVVTLPGKPSVIHDSLGSSTYNIKVQYWIDTFNQEISGAQLKTKLIENCLAALAEAQIETPGDILELRPLPKMVSA